MLGDIHTLAEGLWMVEGEMPADNERHPDIANVLVYHSGANLYLLDTGVGPVMRASIKKLLDRVGSVRCFALLNSHGHVDHVCNNDLIHEVQAELKYHYLSRSGRPMLDTSRYFAGLFFSLSEYYDPLGGFQASRLKYRLSGLIRDVLACFLGQERALRMLMPVALRKFEPVRSSADTLSFYEELPRVALPIGQVSWTGWVLGEDDVWVLEERGHSPDHVVFYIPTHRYLHGADLTDAYFPLWPDSDGSAQQRALQKILAMAQAGNIQFLTDGHHHEIYRGSEAIVRFLEEFLSLNRGLRNTLNRVFENEEGLTAAEVYDRLRALPDDGAVRWHIEHEYPATPLNLQQTIVLYLLDMGYHAKGPWRRKRFCRSNIEEQRN